MPDLLVYCFNIECCLSQLDRLLRYAVPQGNIGDQSFHLKGQCFGIPRIKQKHVFTVYGDVRYATYGSCDDRKAVCPCIQNSHGKSFRIAGQTENGGFFESLVLSVTVYPA